LFPGQGHAERTTETVFLANFDGSGDQAPGLTPGSTLTSVFSIDGVSLAEDGNVGFFAFADDPAVTSLALFGRNEVYMTVGGPAPGLPGVTTPSIWTFSDINAAGDIVFGAQLADPVIQQQTNFGPDDAIFVNDAAVIRSRDTVVGDISGLRLNDVQFGDFAINDAGDVGFLGRVENTATGDIHRAVLRNDEVVARAGGDVAALPGDETYVGLSYEGGLNNAGQMAFEGRIAGTGVTSANDDGVFTQSALIAREGDQAPGLSAGVIMTGFQGPQIDAAGSVVYGAAISLQRQLGGDGRALYRDDTLIFATDDPVPVMPGWRFDVLGDFAVNDAGDIAFTANLISDSDASQTGALFLLDDSGALDLIVRTDALFDVGDGDLRQPFDLAFGPTGLNNDGAVAFELFVR